MGLRNQEFVLAARAMGVSSRDILLRHILPNLTGIVVVYATLTVPQVILAESFLSFLGLGVHEPLTSWGSLIAEGAKEMENAPWMLIYPGLGLGVTLLCLNFLGDGLRDAFDPVRSDKGVG
jgi:oligopeptide transport system permease protein